LKPNVVFWCCVAAVLFASLFDPKAGVPASAHWMFVHLMGGMVAEVIADVSGVELGPLIDRPLAILFNVGVFVLLIRFWKRNAPDRWYVVGLLSLTVLYLASYFFLLPTRDSP
jgi:hypothetical protein